MGVCVWVCVWGGGGGGGLHGLREQVPVAGVLHSGNSRNSNSVLPQLLELHGWGGTAG